MKFRDMSTIFPLTVTQIYRLIRSIDMDPTSGCWLWTRARQGAGYGVVAFRGRTWLVHRVFYQLFIGPIPDGMVIDHTCGCPSCCNPDHLEAVTQAENVRRAFIPSGKLHHFGRRTHCKYGHPLSGDNLVILHGPDGDYRSCRACNNEKARRHRARLRSAERDPE